MGNPRRTKRLKEFTNQITINARTPGGQKHADDLCYPSQVPQTDRLAVDFFDHLEENTNEEVYCVGGQLYIPDNLLISECGLVGPVVLLGGRHQGEHCLRHGSTESATGYHRYDDPNVPNDYELVLTKEFGLSNGSNDLFHAIDDIHGDGWSC